MVAKTGKRMAAMMAMMSRTTSSSMSVNAVLWARCMVALLGRYCSLPAHRGRPCPRADRGCHPKHFDDPLVGSEPAAISDQEIARRIDGQPRWASQPRFRLPMNYRGTRLGSSGEPPGLRLADNRFASAQSPLHQAA